MVRSFEGERRRAADRSGRARARRWRAPLGLTLIAASALSGGCGAVDYLNEVERPGFDTARMETDLRSQLQRDLESRSRTTSASVASVGRVRCRERSEVEARCSVRVSRHSGRRLRKLAVYIDPDTGRYRWEYVR